LAQRIFERNLQLTYIREDILQDALSPFRLDYLKSILEDFRGVAVNKDFFPVCYFHNLMMWATQWHEVLQKYLNILADLKLRWFWTALAAIGIIIVVIFLDGSPPIQGGSGRKCLYIGRHRNGAPDGILVRLSNY
jgi:spermidine synthase